MTLKAYYWKYSTWAAILNTIPIIIYLFFRHYSNTWLLYVGNLLFSAVVMIGVFRGYHRIHDTASVRSSFMMGLKITIYGILIAIVLCAVVLIINSMFTGLNRQPGNPAQTGRAEVLFTIFSNTIGNNGVLGALAALIGATVVKKNQKTDHGKTLY